MSGYLNNFEQQINTLNSVYYELLAPIEKQSTLKNWWVFGGGTALAMFHFNHRKSFDIDIFVTESQLFDFLNPKWYIDETNLFDSNEYRFDGINHHVQLKTKDDIKVDFLLNESIINNSISDQRLHYTLDDLYNIFSKPTTDKKYQYAITTIFNEVNYDDVIKYCEIFNIDKTNLKTVYEYYKDQYNAKEISEYEWLFKQF